MDSKIPAAYNRPALSAVRVPAAGVATSRLTLLHRIEVFKDLFDSSLNRMPLSKSVSPPR